jgi:Ni/Co efflux regulator RcnB
MKALVVVFSMLAASVAVAQDRRTELDKAYEEARSAQLALKDAEARRDQGVEPQAGEVQGTASGGTRPSDQYRGRQMLLEQEAEVARRRYEAALKRWNDLK